MTREEILDIYYTLKRNLGRKPSGEEFHRITRVKRRDVIKGFRSYGELMEEAGDTPYKFKSRVYRDEDYMETLGGFLRETGRRPTQSDWLYRELKPIQSAYTRRFKCRWAEMCNVFYAWAEGKPEWADVREVIERKGLLTEAERRERKPEMAESEGLYMSVPPSVSGLIELAYGNGQALAFERKCAEAFGMLGYEVRAYGQGKGRMPDGVAEDPISKYAVIYDAKSRKSRYTPGTDDRRVCEYIREQRKVLTGRGFDMVYFLTVSSEFGLIPPAWIFRVQSETGCPPSFITAENMLRLIAMKIRNPRTVDTGAMKRLFVNAGEIREKDVKGVV
ncbi:MAG: hypothetical protein KDC73_12950 [Ignavibacteriae bacterium]|nr:hypothetical protein [Ignavibacteriota bacterium]MCB9242828.1 hypothetical protein [Ignavibacteriales bacterium]